MVKLKYYLRHVSDIQLYFVLNNLDFSGYWAIPSMLALCFCFRDE